MPDTAYSTWGFWAMSSVDISPDTGAQNASVHLGSWVGGETLAQSEIPTSGTASMGGAAVMKVAYRYNQTGTNYDVHKYTTTANVAAPKAIAPELSSRGVPSNSEGMKLSNVEKISSLRSYLSSIFSPQRSVSPIHGSKLPIIAGISATL